MISSIGGARAGAGAGAGVGFGAEACTAVAPAALLATCSLEQPARRHEPRQKSAHQAGSGTLGLSTSFLATWRRAHASRVQLPVVQ